MNDNQQLYAQATALMDELWHHALEINSKDGFGSVGYAKLIGVYQGILVNCLTYRESTDILRSLRWNLQMFKDELENKFKVEA